MSATETAAPALDRDALGGALDRALDVALLVLRNGGSTSAADRAFHNVLKGFGVTDAATTWRLDYVVARSMAAGAPVITWRPTGAIGANLARAVDAVMLAEDVGTGKAATATLAGEIERIALRPGPYRPWLVVFAVGCIAALFGQVGGGDAGASGVAFVAAIAGQLLRLRLQAREIGDAAMTLLCSLATASVACLGIRLGLSSEAAATLMASIVVMIPGAHLINGFIDLSAQKHLVIGLERIASAGVQCVLIAVAMVMAARIVG